MPKGKKHYCGLSPKRRGADARTLPIAFLVTVMAAICLFVLFKVPVQAASNTSGSTQMEDQTIATPKLESSAGNIQDQSINVVVTDQDLAKAYREVFQQKREKSESQETLKAGKGSCYRVTLVSGRSLLAVEIQAKGDTVILTDSGGMVISMAKRRIADIKKIQN